MSAVGSGAESQARLPESAMKAVPANERQGASATRTERAFIALLAELLHINSVPVDSHFFDELGADSLLMAQFCARVRKQQSLPVVTMRDVYAHPTVRRLAAAISGPAWVAHAAVNPGETTPRTPTRTGEQLLCGALQALFYFGYTYLGVLLGVGGYQWLVASTEGVERALHLVLFGAATFLVVCVVPILAKWLLIGRWKPQSIRLWSLDYFRFWVVKMLIRSNPGVHLFVGTPLYGLYLRALGAKVGPGVVILSRRIPVCTDLLTIGAGTVIRREVSFQCYRAQAGRIETGTVTLGSDVQVGEMAVLDIDTSMGDGAQLAHASALLSGQAVPASERWHGSPARHANTAPAQPVPARSNPWRRRVYAAVSLLGIALLLVPLLEGSLGLLFVTVSTLIASVDPSALSATGVLTLHGLVLEALAFSALIFFGALLVGLLAVGILPRVLSLSLQPGRVYQLYGFHYAVQRFITGLCRLRFPTALFGDSSHIVNFLSWVGYRLSPVVQTGSNFGGAITTTNPTLTTIGRGTKAAHGLNIIADEISSTSFRVSWATIGPRNVIGDCVTYPAGGRTADNCLLAIKVMVPTDGPIRQGVGLLGSPPFVIPRSFASDSRYDHLRSDEAMRRGLTAKDPFNLRTIWIALFTRWLGVFLIVLIDLAAVEYFHEVWAHAAMAALFSLSAMLAALYFALVARCCEALGPPTPDICSIYDLRFWWVERVRKMHPINFFHLFDGTPFKSLIWWVMGVHIGRRVFDDGAHIAKPSLTALGDECVLNYLSRIHCDSQEDNTYKSGASALGAGCTVGVAAFVHYGVTMGNGAELAADAFLMKGEEVPPHARWAGNPAWGD